MDLQLGERCASFTLPLTFDQMAYRFANTDYALALALRQRVPGKPFTVNMKTNEFDLIPPEDEHVDRIVSYDSMCQYSVHVVHCFKQNPEWADLVPVLENMRWSIPALHVVGHKDSCTYEFSTAYMECTAHFHGETAEQYWPEANQLGGHTCQMNNGNCQDTIIDHHNHWNWKKTEKMGELCFRPH